MARGQICVTHLETEGRHWLSGLAYRLGKNGQTVYTICVNIGSLDLQAVAGEVNYLNVTMMHMHLTLKLYLH
jgi:hypothetical protein